MPREEIDIKSIKKLNKSGKPKKKYTGNKKFSKPQAATSVTGKSNVARIPEEWLYMSKNTDSPEVVKKGCEELGYNVEYWPELGIIEVTVDETTSMDCEILDSYENDDVTAEYIKNNQIKLALVVSTYADKYGKLKEMLKNIADKTGGFFCEDNGKFQKLK